MQKARYFALIILLFTYQIITLGQRTNQIYWTYIDNYKGIAVEQMQMYKIPASITLAQGLIESKAGRSTLATKANNHFGIKVGSSWTGPYILRDDDAKNEKFRKYRSARESYEDHSKFLQGKRYQELFTLKLTDYKGWARGLKKAGYATNPNYANILISTIEMYNLHQFDNASSVSKYKQNNKPTKTVSTNANTTKSTKAVKSKSVREIEEELFFQKHAIYKNNRNYFIVVEIGDDMATISRMTGLSLRALYSYNDLPMDYAPTQGDILYLHKKKKSASRAFRKNPIHIVEQNQSMFDISQLYGIQIKYLYQLNKLSPDYSIKPGDILRIR